MKRVLVTRLLLSSLPATLAAQAISATSGAINARVADRNGRFITWYGSEVVPQSQKPTNAG